MKKLLCSVNLLVILALVLAGIFISGADNTRVRRHNPSGEQNPSYDPNNPPVTIAVEAYLAQIPDEALIEIGLPLIPTKESETITVDKLSKCLTSTKVKGKIVSSGQWTAEEGRECGIRQNNTFYLKREQITGGSNENQATSVHFEQYNSETSGNITLGLNESNKIWIRINFGNSGFSQNNQETTDNEIPPAKTSYNLTTELSVNNDLPIIVGAVKQGNSVLYLVVRAKVLDE